MKEHRILLFVCLAFLPWMTWTHRPRLASIYYAVPLTICPAAVYVLSPSAPWDEWDSEDPVEAVLDSCRHESSCNIWWLGRGVGLKLGKLLWHPCPHERQPSTTASSWSSCTTQADNCWSGWDHESSNSRTLGPWAFRRSQLGNKCPERSQTYCGCNTLSPC